MMIKLISAALTATAILVTATPLPAAAQGMSGQSGYPAMGAAAAPSQAQSGSTNGNHVAQCQARYHSYNAKTDTYVGASGKHHRCNL